MTNSWISSLVQALCRKLGFDGALRRSCRSSAVRSNGVIDGRGRPSAVKVLSSSERTPLVTCWLRLSTLLRLGDVNRVPHLSLVVDQIELDMPGVPPLSTEQRLRRWLEDQGEETPAVIEALLLIEDDRTRDARVGRYFDIEIARRPFESEDGWFIPGGSEAWWLYQEAERAYISGLFMASLLCSHAASERALAGCLADFADQLPPTWQRWGLTPLAAEAGRRQIVAPDLEAQLKDLAERRKVSAHYKPPLHPNSVLSRSRPPERPESNRHSLPLTVDDVDQEFRDEALRAADEADQAFERKIASVLREDALFGLGTVIELLGGDHGHPLIGRV